MSETALRLKDELARLPVDERADIAQYLLETLDDNESPTSDEQFDEELTRRGKEILHGTAKGRPAADVVADLRKEFP